MADSKGFDWRSLGKADYSQACALVASLPADVRDGLKGGERELLCRITFIVWSFAAKTGKGTGYCWPSQSYLSKVLKRSERTIRRYLTVLQESGLLTSTRRTTQRNVWTSNLYKMGARFLASLIARQSKKVQQIHQRTKMADNDLKREYKADAPIVTGGRVSDFIMKKYASLGLCPPGARPALATT